MNKMRTKYKKAYLSVRFIFENSNQFLM